MLIARTIAALGAHRRALGGRSLALVPTMGALHAGHVSLLRAARAEAAVVWASIFVNPLQFAPGEDFTRYPRDEAGDLAALRTAGCDLVWLPALEAMYPPGDATVIDVAGPASGFESISRPTHFRGVATVVARLFGQTRPDLAVFGEKDWQQVQVVRRMTADLSLGVRIVVAPVVREADGLAMSSRNRYLSAADRTVAPALHAALARAASRLLAGDAVESVLNDAREGLTVRGFAVEYLSLIDGETMAPADAAGPGTRLVAAARLGSTRLLDTMAIS